MPDSELDKIVSTMDESVDRISKYDMLDAFAKRTGGSARYTDDDRTLTQAAVRAMYVSAAFRSLPEDAQLHPAMQERMVSELAVMDHAVYGMNDRMSTLDQDGRNFVRAALSNKRTNAESISQTFDHGMGALKMPVGKRFQARSIFSKVGWRMEKQPAVFIDEYSTKLHKASALVGSQIDMQRALAAQMGHERYWKHQRELALMLADDPGLMPPGSTQGSGAPPPTGSGTPVPMGPGTPVPIGPGTPVPNTSDRGEASVLMTNARIAAQRSQCQTVEFLGRRIAELDEQVYRGYLADSSIIQCLNENRNQRMASAGSGDACSDAQSMAKKLAREKVVGTGGWMLGIGLLVGVLSALVVNAGSGAEVLAAIGLTVGAALLVGGLVVVVVGAGMARS